MRWFFFLLLSSVLLAQTPSQKRTDDFSAQMSQMRETWVREFNAGHAEAVANFYASDALLMRWTAAYTGTTRFWPSSSARFPAARTTMLSTVCALNARAIWHTIPGRTTSHCATGWSKAIT